MRAARDNETVEEAVSNWGNVHEISGDCFTSFSVLMLGREKLPTFAFLAVNLKRPSHPRTLSGDFPSSVQRTLNTQQALQIQQETK